MFLDFIPYPGIFQCLLCFKGVCCSLTKKFVSTSSMQIYGIQFMFLCCPLPRHIPWWMHVSLTSCMEWGHALDSRRMWRRRPRRCKRTEGPRQSWRRHKSGLSPLPSPWLEESWIYQLWTWLMQQSQTNLAVTAMDMATHTTIKTPAKPLALLSSMHQDAPIIGPLLNTTRWWAPYSETRDFRQCNGCFWPL